MGTEQKVTLSRILQIAEAVSLVGENTLLDGTTAYRIGRLGDFCKAPVKLFNREVEKKRKEVYEKQRKLEKDMIGKSNEEKQGLSLDIQEQGDDLTVRKDALLDQEESIKIPELKLSDFLCKEERKVVEKTGKGEDQKNVEITIKPGAPLVPVRFFTLMGDFIIDDKSALKFEEKKSE